MTGVRVAAQIGRVQGGGRRVGRCRPNRGCSRSPGPSGRSAGSIR